MNSLFGMAIVKTFVLVLTVFQPIYWSFYNDFLTDEGNVSFVLAILDTKQDHCFLLLTLISTICHIQTPMAFCSWPSYFLYRAYLSISCLTFPVQVLRSVFSVSLF